MFFRSLNKKSQRIIWWIIAIVVIFSFLFSLVVPWW